MLIVSCEDDNPNECIEDCLGDCGGDAIIDNCGDCDDDASNDCVEDCNGSWSGTAVEDCLGDCDGTVGVLPNGEILYRGIFLQPLENNKLELLYHSQNPIFGFQLDIYGITINDIIEGDAQDAGLNITYHTFSNEGFVRILGYRNDLENEELIFMPSSCGTLLGFSYEGAVTDIKNIVFGGIYGGPIIMTYYPYPS